MNKFITKEELTILFVLLAFSALSVILTTIIANEEESKELSKEQVLPMEAKEIDEKGDNY